MKKPFLIMSVVTMLVSIMLNCLYYDKINSFLAVSMLRLLKSTCSVIVVVSFCVTIILGAVICASLLIHKIRIFLKFKKNPGEYWYLEGVKYYNGNGRSSNHAKAARCFSKAIELKEPKGIDGLIVLQHNDFFKK